MMRYWGSRRRMPAYVLHRRQNHRTSADAAANAAANAATATATATAAAADDGNEEWRYRKRLKLHDGDYNFSVSGDVLPQSPGSSLLPSKNSYAESVDESPRSDSGSCVLPTSPEASRSTASQHAGVIKSKPAVRHFLFKRPVAIKSKNCLEVVKKKTVRLESSPDANTPYLKSNSDQKLHQQEMCLEQKGKEKKEHPAVELFPEEVIEDAKARSLVRETLKQFDLLRRETLQEGSHSGNRADLKAGMIIKRKNLRINQIKRVGTVPGIEVGDKFFFRIEMLLVGLHRQVQAGIDFIVAKQNKYNEPVAVSIVASVGYCDYDLHEGETLIYNGQGGNIHKDQKLQEDQKLVRGNLALQNSHKLNLPVRVIRCYDKKTENSDKLYTYDGLYQVERIWKERGTSGCLVYKFCLQRLAGQAPLRSAFAFSC